MSDTCPVCGSRPFRGFYTVRDLPVQDGALWPTREAALGASTGDISLAFCDTCGFIANTTFEPDKIDYANGYDISLAWSPLYRRFLDDQAAGLVARYDLHDRVVLEIGCGTGEFLTEICRLGPNCGIGFDPSLSDEMIERLSSPTVSLVRDYYGEQYADATADLIATRHVLECLPDPMVLLRSVRRTLADDARTVVYCEVPDAGHIFGDGVTWDVTYESNSYFARPSLDTAFRLAGFTVLDSGSCFEGEYVAIEARPGAALDSASALEPDEADEVDALRTAVDAFAETAAADMAGWRDRLPSLASGGRRIAAWGAGGRAVSWLAGLGIRDEVALIADINPGRQGMFMPVTGQVVVSPEALADSRPDIVVITNPAFGAEIRAQGRALGMEAQFIDL